MKELLKLAREAINSKLEGRELKVDEKVKKEYSDKRACFVTLTQNGVLRGCIGSLEARQELWKDVVENALNAGFHDFRFFPVSKKDMKDINIEISVLTKPEKFDYKSIDDLKKRIFGKGLIIKKGWNSATYLPQVWEQIEDEEEFLSSLCEKAGMAGEEWRKGDLEVWTYDTEKVSEIKE